MWHHHFLKLNDKCFCCFTAAMLVPLGRAPTWRFHTKLHKFRWNSFPNNAGMKNRIDPNLGEIICLSIIYHIPHSWLTLLNGYDFYFRCKPPITQTFFNLHWRFELSEATVFLLPGAHTSGVSVCADADISVRYKFTTLNISIYCQFLCKRRLKSRSLSFAKSRPHIKLTMIFELRK